MKKLTIFVFRNGNTDCTNGGISSKRDMLTMVVYADGETPNPADGDLMLVRRVLWGKRYDYLSPITEVEKGNVGWMMGGNFGYTSDSRFEEYTESAQPLPIHDRQETQEEYDFLSR